MLGLIGHTLSLLFVLISLKLFPSSTVFIFKKDCLQETVFFITNLFIAGSPQESSAPLPQQLDPGS